MAATWLKPLHVNKGKSIAQTITERTDYAGNPEKTEKGDLVVGYACDPRTVDAEFLLSKREYEYLTGRSQGKHNILAYHMRQSFKPGEITPEEAQAVGYELAYRFTKGKHAFIVAVHTDKKHVHCHIIFNSTTLDCTRKFNNFRWSSFAVRRLSDLICAEHGLSVIENPKQSPGRDYGEWLGEKKPLSWRAKLKQKIDEVVPACDSFDAFLSAMRMADYTVNTSRKHITFLAPGQKRPARLDTLGNDYTEAAIRDRIAGARVIGAHGGGRAGDEKAGTARPEKPFNLLIDIQEKIRQGKGAGYQHWAKTFNLREAARTLIFLQESGITSYEDLVSKAASASASFRETSKKIKAAEARMDEISVLQKNIAKYIRTRDVYKAYREAGYSAKFRDEHEADIIIHQAAKRFFDSLGLKKLPTIQALKQEFATLLAEKKKLYAGYHETKEKMRQLVAAKHNAERILGVNDPTSKARTQTHRDHTI